MTTALRTNMTQRHIEENLTTPGWDEKFNALVDHKGKTGHLRLSDASSLERWAQRQREQYRARSLPEVCIKKLDSIGFSWEPHKQHNKTMIGHLRDFQREHGHLLVPRAYKTKCNVNLGAWVRNARHRNKESTIGEQLKQSLDSMGFVWQVPGKQHKVPGKQHNDKDFIDHLKDFQSEHGHVRVPFDYKTKCNVNLGTWVCRFRSRNRNREMDEKLKQALDSMGFSWQNSKIQKHNVIAMIGHLRNFKREHEHLLVPRRYQTKCNVKLGWWVSNIRYRNKKGLIDDELKEALDSMGFSWQAGPICKNNRKAMIGHLRDFKHEHGDLLVPRYYRTKCNVDIGGWVAGIRERNKKGRIAEDWQQTLDSMGFAWQVEQIPYWHPMIGHLREFKHEHGHLRVPTAYKTKCNIHLGEWVKNVRNRNSKGMVGQDLSRTLDSMGFIWDSAEGAGLFRLQLCEPATSAASHVQNDHGSHLNMSSPVSKCNSLSLPRTPEPTGGRKKFWRPPTPYPSSDDEE